MITRNQDLLERDRPTVAVLFGIDTGDNDIERMTDELERLLDTAGGVTAARLIQSKSTPDPRTYLGSGKVQELRQLCETQEAELAVCNDELSPAQIKNMENEMGGNIRVIDRSMLILDIFALHAVTGEGKLQVELAQLKYTTPRLTGRGLEMSRQGGGAIAARGPGETKLESDRRYIRRRIQVLEERLEEMAKNRQVQRAKRDGSGLFRFAVAGYTNAGKSTLMNYLTDAGILAQDKLFATLDPTTRAYTLPSGMQVLLTDTVGFIRNLPHHLIRAFASTLDEVRLADGIIVLIDASDPAYASQLEVTRTLLHDLEADSKPVLYVFNKCDLHADEIPRISDAPSCDVLYISARTGEGCDALISRMEALASDGKTIETFRFPHGAAGQAGILYTQATVLDVQNTDTYMEIRATVDARVRGKLRDYLV